MLKQLQNKNGFTLIEILITIVILGIVIVPLSGMAINALKINNKARAVLEANNIAQQYMENIKANSLSDLLNETALEKLNQGLPVILPEESYEGYTLKVEIIPQTDYSNQSNRNYIADAILKTDIAANKLNIYENAQSNASSIELNSTYTIDIDNVGGTRQIRISDIVISTANMEETILMIINDSITEVAFNINNNTESDAVLYVLNEVQAYNPRIIAQNGRIKTYTSTANELNNTMYQIKVSVSKNDESLTTIIGLKLMELK